MKIQIITLFPEMFEGVLGNSMPLKKEFWGDIFGSLTDKYNINWMMNIAQPKS